MAIFGIEDVFRFAIQIETNGEKFYRQMASRFDEPEMHRFFEELALQEVGHQTIFRNLARRLGQSVTHESYPGEFNAFLEAYTEKILFSETILAETIEKISDFPEAIRYAIDKELDSVLYYQEIKQLIPASEHSILDGIIEEERRHVVRLSEYGRKIARQ